MDENSLKKWDTPPQSYLHEFLIRINTPSLGWPKMRKFGKSYAPDMNRCSFWAPKTRDFFSDFGTNFFTAPTGIENQKFRVKLAIMY